MAYAVLTRDAAGAKRYATALSPLGLECIAMPVTHTAPAPDPDALKRALLGPAFDAILIASPRAAAELVRARDESRIDLPPVWAVGEATQRALVAAQIAAIHPTGVRDGAELASRLAETRPRRVLAPRAEEGRDEPIALLRAAGTHVEEVIAYRTLPLPPSDPRTSRGLALLTAAKAPVCVAFAPSQVTALGALLAARGVTVAATRATFVAIGETTAGALRQLGAYPIAVADEPTPEGIAKAVSSVYRSPPP
jgi:uroporphyrinogen-III synthase